MSTIASLISLIDPSAIKPWYEGQQGVNREQIGRQQAQTGLIELQRLKQSQASEEEVMAYYREHPELLVGGGGSILGSLGPAGAPPGASPPGAITQSPLGGGPAQQIPAYPDASRYAGVSPQGGGPIPPDVMAQTMPQVTPPQSTIASLGPQPQGGMPGPPQGPQNPLMELVRRDPRAGLLVQQQMQQSQDTAMKRQEQNLKLGAATLGYVGQQAQGVTDQASLDALRSDLQSQGLGKYAAQLPQLYSKDAMQPFIAKALDVKEALTLQVQDLTAQAALIKARKEGRATEVDNELIAMGVQPGQETPGQMRAALDMVKQGKKEVSAVHGTGQIVQTPTGYVRIKPGTDQVEEIKGPSGEPLQPKPTQAETETATYSTLARQGHTGAVELEKKGFTPGFWAKAADKLPLHMGNYLTSDDYQKYKDYVTDFAQAWLRRTSKGLISESEWKLVDERYFPQPGNSKAQVEQKRAAREAVIKELEAEGKGTGRTGNQGQGQPQGQGPLKPAAQMSREEIAAEIAAIKARGGK